MNFLVESVEVKDLKEGDEILAASQSSFRYFKVLKEPKLSKAVKKAWWPINYVPYSTVKCSTKVNEIPYQRTWGGKIHNYTEKVYEVTPDDHNKVMYVNLNRSKILRVIK